jgi:hypothetical protein
MLRLTTRDGEHCVWCRRHLTYASLDATVDHIRCRSRGGTNVLDNLVLACAACNHRRSDQTAEAWLWRCLELGLPVDRDAVTAAIRRAHAYTSANSTAPVGVPVCRMRVLNRAELLLANSSARKACEGSKRLDRFLLRAELSLAA